MLKLQLFEDPGHYVKLTTLPVTIGRDGSNDLILADPRVSDFHAEINGDPEGLYIVDLLSASGTLVNEHRVVDRTKLKAWDIIRVGTIDLEINDPNTCRPDSWVLRTESDLLSSQFYTLQKKTVVGRDPECDLTIDWHLLSRQHAELLIEQEHLRVVDLGSRNGTYLNGERIEDALAFPGDELRFDEQRFIVVGPSRGAVDDDSDEDRTQLRGFNPDPDPDQTQFAPAQESLAPVDAVSHDADETRLMPAATDDETQLIMAGKPVDSEPLQQAIVTVNSGGQAGARVIVEALGLIIGRDAKNDFVLDETGVSKQHAEIGYAGGHWYIKDLDSSNGVHVNDATAKEFRLQTGDKIILGQTELIFECDQHAPDCGAGAETLLYSRPEPAIEAQRVAKSDGISVKKPPGSKEKASAENTRSWLPGVAMFIVTVSIAAAVYLWRSGKF